MRAEVASESTGDPPRVGGWRRVAPWLVVLALTVVPIVVTGREVLRRYDTFQTGWPWDLAYYNQWFWALTLGGRTITVRPFAAYATEGPSVFQTNYLAPIRYVLAPVYRLAPGPATLLLVHATLFWLVVPAAFTLARSESRSTRIGLAAAALVPMTPFLWPLALNDFREIQLALPFVLWGVQGVRERRVGLAAVGALGMLFCRQEMSVVVASLAFLPAREPEDVGQAHRWAHALIVSSMAWFLFGFLGSLRIAFGPGTAMLYLSQFSGQRPGLGELLDTSAELLALGLGAWVIFLVAAPRVVVLMLPWLWILSSGRWSMRMLSSEEWHHVRYAAPFVALGLAAGVVGFARFAAARSRRPGGGWSVAAVWLLSATVSVVATGDIVRRMASQTHPMELDEARAVWRWIGEVAPDDGVLAAYEVSAPLSSRTVIHGYTLPLNRPPGYPDALRPAIRWVFWRNRDGATVPFERQGFVAVHRGPFLTVLTRPRANPRAAPE